MPSIQSHVAGQSLDRGHWKDQISPGSKLEKLGFERLPGSTLKTAKSAQALINSQELFKDYFRSEVKAMTEGMNPAHVEAFTAYAEKTLEGIVKSTFGKMEDRLVDGKSIKSPIKHMREANKLATKFLTVLQSPANAQRIDDIHARLKDSRPMVAPQLVRGSDGHFNLIRAAPLIENLVLEGGGAKGIGYPPALREMHDAGMLGGLKQVVGTSAGAITAVSIAAGQSAQELESILDQDIGELLKSKSNLNTIYPEVAFHKQLGGIPAKLLGGDAQSMIQLLDQMTGDKVKDFLGGLDHQNGDPLRKLADDYSKVSNRSAGEIYTRLQKLGNPNYTTDRSGKMITFSDMKMLHAMAPQKFKEIQLTGYDSKDRAGRIFNSDTTPDLPVAFAARISMAHPLIASAISLDPRFGLGGHVFNDGGISSNTPTEAIYGEKSTATKNSSGNLTLQETHARTAVMIFDTQGIGYTALHDAPENRTSDVNSLVKKIVKNPNMGQDWQSDLDKTYRAGPNTFIVFHGSTGTTDTKISNEKKATAQALATLRTLEQINNRRNEAYAVEVDSVDNAFKLLTDEEKQMIARQGPPRRQDFTGSTGEQNFIAADALYDLSNKYLAQRA